MAGGATTDGQVWTAEVSVDDASYYGLNNNEQAFINPYGQSGSFQIGLPSTTLLHGEMQIEGTWGRDAGSAGPLQPISLVAQQVDVNNMVRAELIEQPDTSMEIALIQVVDGVETYVDQAYLADSPNGCSGAFQNTLGDWWYLRFRFDGTQLAARAWRDDALTELNPTCWQAVGTIGMANTGSTAVRYANSNTNVQPYVIFDNFWVQTVGLTVSAFVYTDPGADQGGTESWVLSKGPSNAEYYWRYEPSEETDNSYDLRTYVFNLEGGLGAGQRFRNVAPYRWYHIVQELDPGDANDSQAGVSGYINGVYQGVQSGAYYQGDQTCIGECSNGECESESGSGSGEQLIDCWRITPRNGPAPVDFAITPTAAYSWRGQLDEVAIFAGKLSCSDVASIYDASCQPAIGPFTGLNATASSTDQRCIRDRGEVECSDLFPAANAVDGTLNTPWRSATLTGSVRVSITLDLGVEQNVSQVTLYPEAGYVAASYQINVSLDNANWTTVASMAGEGAGNPQTDPWVNLRDTFK